VTTPRIAQLHRMNLGTITMTSGVVDLRYASGRRIGSIDESFIAFVDVGERFYFAGKTLQLVRLEPSEAIVKPARGRTSRTPHWSGIRLPISESLAAEIRATVGERAAGMKTPTTGTAELRAAEHFFEIQEANSRIPTSDQTLVELAATRDGFHCFMFPFEGRSVHGGLAALLALRLARRIPATFTTAVNDYGFEILCPSEFPFEAELTGDRGRELFSLDHLAEDARESVNISALAKLQFREIARVSGLVFQTYPGGGGRKSGRQMSASSSLIYEVLEQFDPQNLLLEQARREVLDKQFESSRLARTLSRLAKSELLFVRTERPTPLSFPLMIERVGAKLSTESISDRIARMQEAWEESAS
jgi:ATP-dependent Lhr-like helicase